MRIFGAILLLHHLRNWAKLGLFSSEAGAYLRNSGGVFVMQLLRRHSSVHTISVSWLVRGFDIYLLAELCVLGFCKHCVRVLGFCKRYVCVRVCVYVYTHTHIYTHIHTHTRTHTYTHMEGGKPKFGFSTILLSEICREKESYWGCFLFILTCQYYLISFNIRIYFFST